MSSSSSDGAKPHEAGPREAHARGSHPSPWEQLRARLAGGPTPDDAKARRDAGVLKRLRHRLVAIIMGLAGAVLVCVVTLGVMSSHASMDELVERSLSRALEEQASGGQVGAGGMEHLPVLWFEFGSGDVVMSTNEAQFSISADEVSAAISDALASSGDAGRVEATHLSWRSASTTGGWRIAIADTTSIDAALVRQDLRSLALAAGALAALFAVAQLLARWALRPVERAWEQQHQFVADASHELKTPLAVILANTQILSAAGSGVPADARRWLESTAEEAQRMRGLVEGLLELARTQEAGGSARRDVDVDLSATVEGEALQFDAVAFERGCEIVCEIEGGLHVMGDPQQLGRLVKTFVDNACKYASAHSRIDVALGAQGGWVELTVTNQGTPIDAEDLPHVFDRFYRSDKARARATGGFGLGLAIARGIAEAHGGKVFVTSDAETGTRFGTRLPLAKAR